MTRRPPANAYRPSFTNSTTPALLLKARPRSNIALGLQNQLSCSPPRGGGAGGGAGPTPVLLRDASDDYRRGRDGVGKPLPRPLPQGEGRREGSRSATGTCKRRSPQAKREKRLHRVVHLELHRMRGVLEAVHLGPFQLDVALDLVPPEHVARKQELVVGGQRAQRLAQAA